MLRSLLCLLLSAVTAVDHRQAVYDVAASTNDVSGSTVNDQEPQAQQQQTNRRTRMRHTVESSSSSSSSSSTKDVAVDPFNDYMVLAENEDALVRALSYTASSLPPGVSSH
jgi:hypothetical protein